MSLLEQRPTRARSVHRGRTWAIAFLAASLVVGAAPAFAQEGPVGTWNLKVDWPNGPADVVLVVTETDGELGATWTGPQGKLTADAVSFAKGVLTFTLPLQDQNGAHIKLSFEARITGSAIDGYLLTPAGRQIKVTGKRK